MSTLHRSFASYLVITVKWPKITFRGSKMVPKVANYFLFGEEGNLVYKYLTLVESWMGNLPTAYWKLDMKVPFILVRLQVQGVSISKSPGGHFGK